ARGSGRRRGDSSGAGMNGQKTVVHLVRHGEVHNPEGILYGRLPGYRLSDRGEQQAKMVAEFLAGGAISKVIASPQEGAQQTAEPIAARCQIEVDPDERLIKTDNKFDSLTV